MTNYAGMTNYTRMTNFTGNNNAGSRKMNEIKKYYELQETDNTQYEKLLKTLSQQTTSREFFSTANGQLELKRKQLHTEIIDQYLKKYSSQNKPYIHFVLGSIGSGKTSLKDSVIQQKEVKSFLYINFDEIKKQFPEYQILKKLNPKKAAQFVQSESAKLAGTLYKKAIQKKINIIYEKNLRLNKDSKLHLISEIKKVFKKNYNVSIHVVFLDSYQEAWRRVQLRYEKIKRYVPKKEVKNTFDCLFPNLNILLNENFKKDYMIKFWYNGKWDSNISQKAYLLGFLIFCQSEDLSKLSSEDNRAFITGNGVDHNNHHYYYGFMPIILFLPKKVQKKMMKITHSNMQK